jgi:lysophospholipase L1-like esterase
MPYHSLTPAENVELWDDGLHFTPKGYEKIGNILAKALVEILRDGSKKNLG